MSTPRDLARHISQARVNRRLDAIGNDLTWDEVAADAQSMISDSALTVFATQMTTCLTCGNQVGPYKGGEHERRHGHTPVIKDGTGQLIWSMDALSWIASTPA